jgi:hypothetical protein
MYLLLIHEPTRTDIVIEEFATGARDCTMGGLASAIRGLPH